MGASRKETDPASFTATSVFHTEDGWQKERELSTLMDQPQVPSQQLFE